jgi:hypothetical protein
MEMVISSGVVMFLSSLGCVSRVSNQVKGHGLYPRARAEEKATLREGEEAAGSSGDEQVKRSTLMHIMQELKLPSLTTECEW